MARKLLFLCCNLLLPLLVGATFYLPGISSVLEEIKIVRNHLPDMLWSYSLVFALIIILGDVENAFPLGLISGAWGSVMELMQLLGFVLGTFDMFDVLVEFAAGIIAVEVYTFWRMRNEEIKDYRNSIVS